MDQVRLIQPQFVCVNANDSESVSSGQSWLLRREQADGAVHQRRRFLLQIVIIRKHRLTETECSAVLFNVIRITDALFKVSFYFL